MTRRLFLDTANLSEIRQLAQTTAIAGVTTNPSLTAKEKKRDYRSMMKEIAETLFQGPMRRPHLSIEVTTLDLKEMVNQALVLKGELSGMVDIHIKIPFLFETLPVITRLAGHGVAVNATACMTAGQAKLAADAGAHVVSFFYNRMKDWAQKNYKPIQPNWQLGGTAPLFDYGPQVYAGQWAGDQIRSFKTLSDVPVICGSIRSQEDVLACWAAGAEYVTASHKIITELVSHEKTTEAITQFQRDIELWQS